jgi:TonB family protein
VRFPLPEDKIHRVFVVAVFCSILLHLLLLGSLFWTPRWLLPLAAQKRGETLFVDLAPDRPAEKAPLGNPAKPPGPTSPPEPQAKAPAPPRPKVPEAPLRPKMAEAPPVRPSPAPPREIAKAPTPAPAPAPKAPAPPEPAPSAPPPQATRPPEPAHAPEATQSEAAKSQAPAPSGATSGSQTALARPDAPNAGIFRHPPGGAGGLHGGQGGTAGEPVPLDTPDPNYREYMQKVKQRIYAKWGYPYEAQSRGLQGKLVIEFHIAKDGHLQFIELKESSGEEILDSFALTAVKLAQVYDPLPDAMRRDVLPIVGTFVYTLRGPLSVLQTMQ